MSGALLNSCQISAGLASERPPKKTPTARRSHQRGSRPRNQNTAAKRENTRESTWLTSRSVVRVHGGAFLGFFFPRTRKKSVLCEAGCTSGRWCFVLGRSHLEGIKRKEKQHFISGVIAGNTALPPLPSHPRLFVPLTPHTSSASLNENTGGRAVSAHAALPQLVHQPGDTVPGQMLEAFSCAGAREQVGN